MISLKFGLVVACTGWAAAASVAMSADSDRVLPRTIGTTERVASDARSGLALAGYDPLTYWVDGAPKEGLPLYEIIWNGVGWRFTSEANKVAFLRDPEAFAPRIGGYDPIAAMSERIVAADPRIFAAKFGRLYLFRTAEGKQRFLADADGPARAEAAWLRLRSTLVAE